MRKEGWRNEGRREQISRSITLTAFTSLGTVKSSLMFSAQGRVWLSKSSQSAWGMR